MTLLHLFKLLRRFWWALVLPTVLCAVMAVLVAPLFLHPVFIANSYIIAFDPVAGTNLSKLSSIAQAQVDAIISEQSIQGVTTSLKPAQVAADSNRVMISVSRGSSTESIEVANSLAEETAGRLNNLYAEMRAEYEESSFGPDDLANSPGFNQSLDYGLIQDLMQSETLFKYSKFEVIGAVTSQEEGVGFIKLCLGGGVLGFCVGLAYIISWDLKRRPILDAFDLEGETSLPILGRYDGKGLKGELWANIQFVTACQELGTLAIIPLFKNQARACGEYLLDSHARVKVVQARDDVSTCDAASAFIKGNQCAGTLVAFECNPLSAGISAVYFGRYTDAAIVCLQYGTDSLKDLHDLLREAEIAEVHIIGIAVSS